MSVVKVTGGSGLKDIARRLQGAPKHLRVGILEGATYPDGTPTAVVGYTHEFGAVIKKKARKQKLHFRKNKKGQVRFAKANDARAKYGMEVEIGEHEVVIPPRPHFRTTVDAREDTWAAGFAEDLVSSDYDYDGALNRLGLVMKGDFQQRIAAIDSPPLAQSTIQRKGHDSVLQDTNHYMNSIDYEVGAGESE